MLQSIVLFVTGVCAAGSLAVAAPTTHTVVTDGVRLEYTSELDDADRIRLVGRASDTDELFILTVRASGRVTGKFGNRDVDFTIGRARRDSLVAALKARQPLAAASLNVETASQE